MLALLADVFGHLNNINLFLQGRNVTVSDIKDKLAGLTAQMGVSKARIKVGFTTCCFCCCDYPPFPRDGGTARTEIQVHAVDLIEIRLGERWQPISNQL